MVKMSPLRKGVLVLWLSIIVLLPLAAIIVVSLGGGLSGFWEVLCRKQTRSAIAITLEVSFIVSLVSLFFGTAIAWMLEKDSFPGISIINIVIDIPFALPTIVASIVLVSLYGAHSPVGLHLVATKVGIVVALAFVTLPFVVRQVQPIIAGLEEDTQEAAMSLGATNAVVFRAIILPSLIGPILTGTGLAFSRAVGEFGSVVLVGGNIPGKTQVASQYIAQLIEIDDKQAAAVVSVLLLVIAAGVMSVLHAVSKKWVRS